MSTDNEYKPYDFKPYAPIHVKMNRYGHLELNQVKQVPFFENWENCIIWFDEKYVRVNDSPECDLYFQLESDVNAILESILEEDKDSLEFGYSVISYYITDEYFMVEDNQDEYKPSEKMVANGYNYFKEQWKKFDDNHSNPN